MLRHSTNPNWKYAEYGMQFAKERFPLGGINRVDIYHKKTAEILPQILILDTLRKQYKSSSRDIQRIHECMAKLRGACCGELAYMTRLAILENFPQACVEIVSFDGHELICIGRKRGNPKDISTWYDESNEGIFLDPWADEIYLISELSVKQNGPPILFYLFGGQGELVLNTTHYLSGKPKILSATNHYKDEDDASLKVIINKRKENPKALYANGIDAFKKNNFPDAIKMITKALVLFEQEEKSSSEIVTCCSTLASCYRELCQYEAAIKYCTQAIDLTAKSQDSQQLKKLQEKNEGIQKLWQDAKTSPGEKPTKGAS